jgi:putative tricarboxylic transport membrane protein
MLARQLLARQLLTRFGRSVIKRPDRLSGAVLIVVAIGALFEASGLPFGSLRQPDSGFFPKSLATLLLLFGLGIVLNPYTGSSQPARFNSESWQVPIAASAFVIYALALAKVGFVLATIAVMLLVMRGLGGMSLKRALLIAVPSVVATYIAFVQLGVPLPRGPLPY